MPVMIAMMLQSDPVSGPPAISPVRLTPPADCPVSDTGDIVVCARKDQNEFRLKRLPDRYTATDTLLPKAEVKIGGATLSAETEGASVGGFASKRAMIRLKTKF